ncbi:MAG: LacI family DNA-binding transcriptional regulator [Armatimonadaceae bacterium]
MATTMKDIARRANVDVSTVSLAINNDPRIRPETRERIVKIARELGYRKNHLARGLRSGRSFTIGAVISYGTAFWGEVFAGAQSVLTEHEYHLLLDFAPDEGQRQRTQIEALKAKRVDGLLIAPPDLAVHGGGESEAAESALYQALHAEGIPFVFLDRFVSGVEADIVEADNQGGARQATHHLRERGHTRIAYLYSPHRMNTAQWERLSGYREAMREAGLTPLLWEASESHRERSEEGRATTEAHLRDLGANQVTAILAATDSTAMGALRALHDGGIAVPQTVAVIGFGGAFTARYLQPPLTTVSLPMREMGAEAARLLLRRIEGDKSAMCRQVLPTTLTARESA